MDSVTRADVFFAVTTGAVVVLSVLVAGVLVYVLRILRDARAVSKHIREESARIVADVSSLRQTLVDEAKAVRGYVDDIARRVAGGEGKDITSGNKGHDHHDEEKGR